MVSTLYTLQIVVVVSMVWRPSHAVIQLSCGSNFNLNPSSVTTYRFGDYTTPYQTGLSCDFDFSLSDANEKILFQVFPQCTPGADVLKINNGNNECCFGCQPPISVLSNTFLQLSLTTDSTSGPEELGFVIWIITGKDESNCTTSSPSPIIVSVGSTPVIITSPGFPNRYPSSRDCRYTISPHDSSKGLSLTFDVISLDYESQCYDKIQLGLYNTDPVDICTNYTQDIFLPNERFTSGGETHLNFSSDTSYEGYGFRVKIVQVDLGATQSPTTASITAVQTVETTSSETTATSTAASRSTETTAASTTVAQTTAASTTAFQSTVITAASAHVGTTTETIVKSTPTSVPATVQSVSSTITASSAESTAVVSTAAPHTDPSTGCPNASYYGDNCSTSCHQNCLDGRCDVVDGTCLGCIQGYIGSTCETGCNTIVINIIYFYGKHHLFMYMIYLIN